jgi:hypothetical protein
MPSCMKKTSGNQQIQSVVKSGTWKFQTCMLCIVELRMDTTPLFRCPSHILGTWATWQLGLLKITYGHHLKASAGYNTASSKAPIQGIGVCYIFILIPSS